MNTIEMLLKSLESSNNFISITLLNNVKTWSRIGNKDSFSELGLEGSELNDFLKDWIDNNPYSNIQ